MSASTATAAAAVARTRAERSGTAVAADELRRLGWLAAQVVALGVLLWLLRIESPAFYERVVPLAIGGAIVHHLLPMRWRLGFFALLSLATIWVVFGVVQGTWIVGIGMALIATCHLPVPFAARVALLLAAGGTLAAMRADILPVPFSPAIWAIVGSMFMFRLIVYVYDIRHLKQRTTWEQRLAYFFCLPNVAFPLFPVIDFATFRRTYYDRPAADIYQEGVSWIVRGTMHLVLYRLVYLYLTLSPTDVNTGRDLIQYAVANYGLYLRVSGQFHLIVGLLHLFGFRLPETHRFFYLASSFSDLWRRINVYWKDFMQKVFYLPLFLRLVRTRGETVAMVVSTALVFVVTWFFHSYQWFWILGTWLWSATDTLFWAFLGACLIVNALREARRGRVRAVGTPTVTGAMLVRHGVQTAAMFTLMCVLWALWTSPTMGSFTALLTRVDVSWRDGAALVALWLAVALAAAVSYRRAHQAAGRTGQGRWTVAAGAACLVGVVVGSEPALSGVVPPAAREVLSQAREPRLNKRDQDQLQRGYYEKIVGVNRFNGELWSVYSGRPKTWETLREAGAVRSAADARLEELVPGTSITFHGAKLTVNSAGLRDREHSPAPAPRTLRVAVLGQSYIMGSGVGDDETFDTHLEARLTREWAPSQRLERVEVLNFGAPSFSAQQQRAALDMGLVGRFAPDVVVIVGHRSEFRLLTQYAQEFLRAQGVGELSAEISQALATEGVTPDMPREEALKRMATVTPGLLRGVYRDIVANLRAAGATPVFALIPTPMERQEGDVPELLRIAEDAGFARVIDLTNVYQGNDERTLIVAPWDRHPNAQGHRLIADALHDQLLEVLAPAAGRAAAR